MSQKNLLEALKRGGFAALSDEAQTDTSTLSLLIKSVKIHAEQNAITFESATALVASRYSEAVTDQISVKETGTVIVPAKELFDWVNRQGDCMIGLRSKDFDSPEIINASTGEADIASKAAIKRVGTLTLASQDASKTGSKWSLDSYDSNQLPLIDYDLSGNPLFEAPLEQLNEGLKYVGFVAMPKDQDHVFDTISFQHKDNKLYLVTTDCARCAIWHVPNADKISLKSTMTAEDMANGMEGAWEHNVLVPAKLLANVCKLASDAAPVEFYRDIDKNRVYISQPGFVIRMATAEKGIIEKFPPLELLLTKKYNDLCTVPVGVLTTRLNTVSIVNKNAILFSFKGDQLTLTGVSESGHAPCKANVSVSNLGEDFKRVWNVQHFLDVLKIMDDDIKVMVPADKDKDSIKLLNPNKPHAAYYAMAIERSKYNMNDED